MIGTCLKCGRGFETTTEEASSPDALCHECWRAKKHKTRGVDAIDHLRISAGEGNVVARSVVVAALDQVGQIRAELASMTASRDRLAAECSAWRQYWTDRYGNDAQHKLALDALRAGRAAVDAAGDLTKGGAT